MYDTYEEAINGIRIMRMDVFCGREAICKEWCHQRIKLLEVTCLQKPVFPFDKELINESIFVTV